MTDVKTSVVTVSQTIRVMSPGDALRTAVVLALEGLCFVSPTGFADDVPDHDDVVDATVAFRGAAEGAITISVPRAGLVSLADVFTLDTPLDAQALTDLLFELCNIVCGNAVPRIYGREAVCDLSPPRLATDDRPCAARAVIVIAGGWVAARLHGAAS